GPDRAGALRAEAVGGGAGGRDRPPHRAALARVLGPPDDDAAGVPHRLHAPLRRRARNLGGRGSAASPFSPPLTRSSGFGVPSTPSPLRPESGATSYGLVKSAGVVNG